MKSKTITVNDIEIVVHSDGSITKPFRGRPKRTFGSTWRNYRQTNIGAKMFLMHRIVAEAFLDDFLDLPQVDHIDGDGANNDVSNLRMATSKQNHRAHQRKPKGCSSQYRGVSWEKNCKKWRAQCMVDGKKKNLGSFDDEREAAIARDSYAFSQGFPLEGLNFPENYV